MNLFKTKSIKYDEIEFICAESDFDVIPHPIPAAKMIPDWFKAIPPKLGEGFDKSTVKSCNPFLDALSIGYIIPLAAPIYVKTNETATVLEYDSRYGGPSGVRRMINEHNKEQITDSKCPNPNEKYPPLKFSNWWLFKTPPEYSLLFVPPLNRVEKRFQCFSGVVDAPYYQHEYVNFPFQFFEENFEGVIEAGTPLVQVIPIRKDLLLKKHSFKKMSKEDHTAQEKTRWKRSHDESHYKHDIHRKL